MLHTEIDQTSHFIDARRLELADHAQAGFRRSEQSTRPEVPIKRMRQNGLHILRGEVLRLYIATETPR